jgi:hypothetical protein
VSEYCQRLHTDQVLDGTLGLDDSYSATHKLVLAGSHVPDAAAKVAGSPYTVSWRSGREA